MSIASEITRIKNNIEDAYTECETKGATLPQDQNSDNLADTIASIPSGGGDLNEYFKTEWSSNPNSSSSIATEIKKIPALTFGSNVTSLTYLFQNLFIKNLVLPTISHQGITNLSNMFEGFKGETIDLNNIFDTTNVTNMYSLFYSCSNITNIYNLNKLKTTNATDISQMFYNCSKLTSLDLSSFDTSNVIMMTYMFTNDANLTSLNLSGWNTSKVASFSRMFNGCSKLTSLDLSSFTIRSEPPSGYRLDLSYMFAGTSKLAVLDISNMVFNSNISDSNYIFYNCGKNCLQSDGAYANGIPYIYVKDATAQNWVLTDSYNGHPSTWTTDNVVIKSN